MKKLCLLLTRFYPRSWRERYGEEFQQMLEEWPDTSLRDATDMLLHCFAIWLASAWAPRQRASTATAAFFFTVGLLCSAFASQGSLELWRSSASFAVLSFLLIPATCAAATLTARRSGSAGYAVLLLSTSLLLPAVLFYVVSVMMAAGANPLPFWKYPTAAALAAADPQALFLEMMQSREFTLHWGRSSLLAAFVAAAMAGPLGLVCVRLDRTWRNWRAA